MNDEIESFFRWIDKTINLAEDQIVNDEMGYGRESGLTLLFIVLEIMITSYLAKIPDLKKYNGKKNGTLYRLNKIEVKNIFEEFRIKQSDYEDFIKMFVNSEELKYFNEREFSLRFILRDGSIVDCIDVISDYELFKYTRNFIMHTGRNLGSDYQDSYSWYSSHKILFPAIGTTDEEEENEHVWLSPETTLLLLKELAKNYMTYCTDNNHDPRRRINPEEFRLKPKH